MPQQDMVNLIAYLKRIETDSDPGLTETSIVIGTLLPDRTRLARDGRVRWTTYCRLTLPRSIVVVESITAKSSCAS